MISKTITNYFYNENTTDSTIDQLAYAEKSDRDFPNENKKYVLEEYAWCRDAYDHLQMILIKKIFNITLPLLHPKIKRLIISNA